MTGRDFGDEHVERAPGRWIGFDLDGCLAFVDMTKPYDGSIGPPIPAAVVIVKWLLALGWEVRVFTARVASPLQRWEGYAFANEDDAIEWQNALIRAWTKEHLGRELEATATKDHLMVALYDDRAVSVSHNFALDVCRVGDARRLIYCSGWLYEQIAQQQVGP